MPNQPTRPFDRAEHCRRISSSGGLATVERYGENYMRDIAKRGYAVTRQLYGPGRAQEIVKGKGWKQPRQLSFEQDLLRLGIKKVERP